MFSASRRVGIDLDDVFAVLETEGVDKFIKSWAELLDSVSEELASRAVKPARRRIGAGSAAASPVDGGRLEGPQGTMHARMDPLMTVDASDVNPLRDPRDKRLPRIAGPSGIVIFGVTGDLPARS